MHDFDPIAEAKRLVRAIRAGMLHFDPPGQLDWEGTTMLIDYIDALTAALHEAYDHLAGAEGELDADFGSLLHTIRHLLED